jgi:hypothetical protein
MSADYDLKYWGYNIGKQFAADGYPSDNPILALLSGHSDVNILAPNFGLNIRDVPARAWQINAIIMRFPRHLRDVLIARYCVPVERETGQPYAAEVLAAALGLHVRQYFRLLRTAREKYLVLSVGCAA